MSVQAILAGARATAESLMTDTCTISYLTGQTTDPLDGHVATTTAVRYQGRCRVQQPKGVGLLADTGQTAKILLRLELQLPVAGTDEVARGDQVLIDASSGDPALVGRRFVVRDLAHKSHASARRLAIEEVT